MSPIASQNLLQNGEKLEIIKGIITSIDTSKDIGFDRIKHIFDLIDNESMEDFNTAPFEKVNIERNGLKGLNNRRSEIEILAVILRAAWNSTKKTELLHQANLSGRKLKNSLVS